MLQHTRRRREWGRSSCQVWQFKLLFRGVGLRASERHVMLCMDLVCCRPRSQDPFATSLIFPGRQPCLRSERATLMSDEHSRRSPAFSIMPSVVRIEAVFHYLRINSHTVVSRFARGLWHRRQSKRQTPSTRNHTLHQQTRQSIHRSSACPPVRVAVGFRAPVV